MSKIFSVDFNKSINDKYGATATSGTTAKLGLDERGMALRCNSSNNDGIAYGDLASINNIGTGEFSFVVGANIKSFINHGSVLNCLAGKAVQSISGVVIFYQSSTLISCYILGSVITAVTNLLNKNNIYIITRNSAGLCTLYINGTPVGTPLTQAGNISTATPMTIGYDGVATTRTPNASIYLAEVYNHCLSETEIQKLTADFKTRSIVTKPKRGFITSKPTDLSKETGLVCAYNMQPKGTTLVDISGNGYNGVCSNVVNNQGGLLYMAGGKVTGNATLQTESSSTNKTLLAVFKHATGTTSVNERIGIQLAKTSASTAFGIYIYPTTGSISGIYGDSANTKYLVPASNLTKELNTAALVQDGTSVKLYINGVMTLSANDAGVVTYSTPVNFNIGTGPTFADSFNGTLFDSRFYNRALSEQEIKDYHNSFVKPALVECFCDAPADGTNIVPREWIAGTGLFKAVEATTDEGNYGGIKKGTKYLQCTSEGTISLPNKTAYGTFEFDFYKGTGNRLAVHLFHSSPNRLFGAGNYVIITSNQEVVLARILNGSASGIVTNTAYNYIANNTWYRLRITRSNTGVFTTYIRGGAFTSWTLVSVAGGSGANPGTDNNYTVGGYLILDADAGDRVANINIKNGIIN
jgi:hypothetical protein